MKYWGQIDTLKTLPGDINDPFLECLGIFNPHSETSSHWMTSMPYQQVSTLVQGEVDVEFGNGSAGSFYQVALD